MSFEPLETQWQLQETDYAEFCDFCATHEIEGVLAELLYGRRLHTADEIQQFLNPATRPLSDPYTLTDMNRAVERVAQGKKDQHHIRIIGDYDVDGISATAIMVRGLKRYGLDTVTFALPDRLEDGYGLNKVLLTRASEDGVQLVITVDNGIMAHESADYAAELGLDLIITDHHTLGESLPRACAVLNPKREANDAPLANICGAAVAFQLCTALNGTSDDLPLVAIATIADVMPLNAENRILTHLGIQKIQDGEQTGIQALLRKAKIQRHQVRASDIAFQVAPRINASGRLGSGGNALDLLLTDNTEEADFLAAQLNAINEERKAVEREISDEAFTQLEKCELAEMRTIVLASKRWHPGVIGIVASKLQHQFQKPVALIAIDDDNIGRSSARSNDDFSLIDAFQNCSHLFSKFGGHRNAAGMTIDSENIPAFQKALEEEAEKQGASTQPAKSVSIDAMLSFSSIDGELLGVIDRLEPLGNANPSPVFATFGVKAVPGTVRMLNGGHLQCTFAQGNQTFPAIGFNMADRIDIDKIPSKIDIAYIPKYNHWQGNTTIQLQLIDIKDSKKNHPITDSL